MRRLPCRRIAALIAIMAALSCYGCGSKQAQHYMLSPTPGLSPVSTDGRSITVGVGRVVLPDYLMRPEIVTRTSASEVRLAEFNRWAEPLDETMVRVLAENLSDLLPEARVIGYPWSVATPFDYRITVNVKSFEQRPDGKVNLAAVWRILDGDGKVLDTGKADLTSEVEGKGYEAIVYAMNTALTRLSEELASALSGSLPRP